MLNSVPKVIQYWADSIKERNAKKMVSLYSSDSILIPTFYQICKGKDKIYNYFIDFLNKNKLTCKVIKNETMQLGNGVSVHNGYYVFEFINDNNTKDNVLARYTYVTDAQGKILVHHSSEQPIFNL